MITTFDLKTADDLLEHIENRITLLVDLPEFNDIGRGKVTQPTHPLKASFERSQVLGYHLNSKAKQSGCLIEEGSPLQVYQR